ncbi:unnamed protein product [Paramecium octaurelia]|uniref:Uncharacterized protein n=1 Tax=Paramecium octaurelia TaxID=43137 RepID=A0A8S1X284_PAROT|nr:unnamed protein product [Paramecium octaurelia]
MQESPLQYLMADQYYLDHSEEYSSILIQENQYLANLNQNDVPIFQSKLIKNPTASLIGNYCLTSNIIFILLLIHLSQQSTQQIHFQLPSEF